ncbi:MAG: hypothetical protein KAT34_12440 [Candidatus Aminicenantes bacterium]|nr:hypothetical protein [Candidatus Aminicenantes bacterium]
MKNKQSGSLVKLIKEKKTSKWWKDFFSWKYLLIPSLRSFLSIFGFVFILFLLSHDYGNWFAIGGKLKFLHDNHYQNLIVILAGIGTLIFALIIFTAESSRNDQTSDRARVLLKVNFLFPLTVGEILTFFIFIWGDVNILSIIPVSLIGIAAVISVGNTISIMLNKYKFARKRAEVLKERLYRSIDKAVDKRIGDIIFFNKLDGKEIKLESDLFSTSTSREGFIYFRSGRTGIITDINLKKLKEFSDILEAHANDNGFYFDPKTQKNLPDSGYNVEQTLPENEEDELKINSKRYILKTFRDQVIDENDILIRLDKELISDNKIEKKLRNIFKKIFRIKNQDDFSEEIRYELEGLKDQFISAINDKKMGQINEYLDIYKNLPVSFLEKMDEIGAHYSYSDAQKERSDLFGGWQEIEWLLYDIRDIYLIGIKSGHKDIIYKISYLPISIIHRSIKFFDHYVFQEFINLHPLSYYYAVEEKSKDIKSLMVESSWRYLKEISNYVIEPQLTREDLTENEMLSLKGYVIHIIIVLQNLLKKAFDKKDAESFTKFRDVVLELFKNFERSTKQPYILNKMREIDDKRTKRQSYLHEIYNEIDRKRKQMLFGLASYIFDQFRNNNQDGMLKLFYLEIKNSISKTLSDFTDIFLETHNFKISDFWGWAWWYLTYNGNVRHVPIHGILERFYVVHALEILQDEQDGVIARMELPHNRDLLHMIEGSRELMKTLNDISNNSEKWKFALSDRAIGKTNWFKVLLQKAKAMQEEKESKEKREKKISVERIDQFKGNFLKTYQERVISRRVFEYYQLFKDKIDLRNDVIETRFGINTVDDKGAFFDDWHTAYLYCGDQYGQSMASGENRKILEDLISWCKKSNGHTIEKVLGNIKPISNAFIIASNMSIMNYFENLNCYIPQYNAEQYKDRSKYRDLRCFDGFYDFKKKMVPVIEYNFPQNDNVILILNKAKLGELIQYSPLSEGDNKALQRDQFYIDVQAYSDNRAMLEEIMKESPGWLKKIGNKNQQELHLLEKVLIKIFQKFELKKHQEFEGYLLKLEDLRKKKIIEVRRINTE